jgi:hypothetical protein
MTATLSRPVLWHGGFDKAIAFAQLAGLGHAAPTYPTAFCRVTLMETPTVTADAILNVAKVYTLGKYEVRHGGFPVGMEGISH